MTVTKLYRLTDHEVRAALAEEFKEFGINNVQQTMITIEVLDGGIFNAVYQEEIDV